VTIHQTAALDNTETESPPTLFLENHPEMGPSPRGTGSKPEGDYGVNVQHTKAYAHQVPVSRDN